MEMGFQIEKIGQFFKILSSVVEKSLKTLLWFVLPWRIHLILSSWCSKSNFVFDQRYFVSHLVYFDQNQVESA